jgi:hypothetical protein
MKDLLKQMFTVLGKGQHRPIINDRNLKDEVCISLPAGKVVSEFGNIVIVIRCMYLLG